MGIQLDAPAGAEGTVESITPQSDRLAGGLKRNEQLVYDALCKSKTPLKAYDILDGLQDYGLRAPMTIYRALEALVTKGYVRKIESLNAFMAVEFGHAAKACAFLICRKCMRVQEILLDDQQVASLFSPTQVSVDDVRVEAFGECHNNCRD